MKLTERVGFEPTAPFGVTGFQDQLLKPLGHLSIWIQLASLEQRNLRQYTSKCFLCQHFFQLFSIYFISFCSVIAGSEHTIPYSFHSVKHFLQIFFIFFTLVSFFLFCRTFFDEILEQFAIRLLIYNADIFKKRQKSSEVTPKSQTFFA